MRWEWGLSCAVEAEVESMLQWPCEMGRGGFTVEGSRPDEGSGGWWWWHTVGNGRVRKIWVWRDYLLLIYFAVDLGHNFSYH